MQAIPSITPVVNGSLNFSSNFKNHKHHPLVSPSKNQPTYLIPHFAPSSSPPQMSGLCMASQVADLFPTMSPEIVVREARIEDFWEVAETHCSSACSLGSPYQRAAKELAFAVIGSSGEESFFLGSADFNIGGFEAKFSLNKGFVAVTVDTVADFLPRKGPLKLRRTGIAYISNVAVRERFRRKGIAKMLIAKAEATAKTWGCLAIALHCDLRDSGTTKLYTSQGFKSIKVPDGANWPRPRTAPDVEFNFMMKLLNKVC